MKTTVLSRLLTTTLTCLEMVVWTLEDYHYSLSESEKRAVTKSGISLVASMVHELDVLTTILHSLDTQRAKEVEQHLCEVANAVAHATSSWKPGEKERLITLVSKLDQPPISPATFQKNTREKKRMGGNVPLRACPSDPESETE